MKKSNRFIFWLVAAWTFLYFGAGAWEKYFGTPHKAVVVTPPYNCDRRPRMIIAIDGTEYRMRPGKPACEDGRYQRGTVLYVKLNPVTRTVMNPREIPEVLFGALILLALFLWLRSKRQSQQAPEVVEEPFEDPR